jgi:bifunctional non-homologous end joining protein LigD
VVDPLHGLRAHTRGVLRFVVQQHAARTLHFDFRLELAGVLVSWAVPKGPSLSPKVRRLAVRVEDHGLDHADFEGILPGSEPGRGAVVIWDRGTWTPDDDGSKALAAGKLTFVLAGVKLRGRWHLVRTAPQGKQEAWLLFKGRDEFADDAGDIVADKPASVVSGRTIAELLADRDG